MAAAKPVGKSATKTPKAVAAEVAAPKKVSAPAKLKAVAPAKAAAPIAPAKAVAKGGAKPIKSEAIKVEPVKVTPAEIKSAGIVATMPEPAEIESAEVKMVEVKVAKAEAPKPALKAPKTPTPKAGPKLAPTLAPETDLMNAENPFAKQFEAVAPAFEKATADVVSQAQAAQEQFTEKLKELMEKNMKSVTEMSDFAKGNVEALVESAKAAAAGAETLTAHFVESSKKAAEEAQAAFKTLSSAKSPNEFIAAHSEYSKAQFDKAVANASHLTETWLKLAGEVVQPISSRVALASETVKKNIAI
ncbi:MAG: phasin [Sphingomonas sp.]|nr:MAG: phasin [Sphingomonas sp.]